jgi:hypothetical protein
MYDGGVLRRSARSRYAASYEFDIASTHTPARPTPNARVRS